MLKINKIALLILVAGVYAGVDTDEDVADHLDAALV